MPACLAAGASVEVAGAGLADLGSNVLITAIAHDLHGEPTIPTPGGEKWVDVVSATAHAGPVRIIFDTDMGSDCDDAGALAVLHAYADRGLAEIVGCIYSSGKVPFGAGIVEAINIYYGRPEIPIGAAHDDAVGDPVDKMTAEKLAKDTAAYGHTIIHSRAAEEMTAVNRRLLAREPDHSVIYLTVGHTKGFHDLLVSEPDDVSPLSGRELVATKVTRWVAMGALGANNKDGHYRKEWNLHFNGSAPYALLAAGPQHKQ